VRKHVREGDLAVDATAGNGHDTAFLAELVGPGGRVWAFDVQRCAIDATAARLVALGLGARVELICGGHETVAEFAPSGLGVVMFNLGYLPGGDHALVTRPETTVRALSAALRLLRPGGVLTCVVYPGHPGGTEEAAAVRAAFARCPPGDYEVSAEPPAGDAPTLITAVRPV
jgi:SAM-dependent methyltransferase